MLPNWEVLATKIALPDHVRWYFKTSVRILIVTDGTITLGTIDFGLSKVVETLENQTFYHNARFIITGATREGPSAINAAATSSQFKFTGFRFDMAGFNINDYDQIWFFGFAPGNDGSPNDANIDAALNSLKSAAEIAILSGWMNAGKGGVLAIGDHHYLGASLCHNIPRVRKMRRWTNADHVPSISGSDRKDTNQFHLVGTTVPFSAQSDAIPQPIEVLRRRYSESIFKIKALPHPILCGANGVIDILPDHPHEGEVLGTRYDSNSGGTPVNLAGNYPVGVPEFPNQLSGPGKPEPQIIAIGHPYNYPEHEKNQPSNTNNPSHTNDTAPFGLLNVYDGAEAGVGRIVTDSTWHHWLNINLVGLDSPASASSYAEIQNFFTNVAVWLCREELRHNMLSSWIWVYLVREFDPMRFSIHDSIWRLGIIAKDVLGRNASQCTATEWILIHLPVLREKFKIPDLTGPCLTCPPFEIFEIAILGGIMKELVPLVEKYRLSEHHERHLIDTKEVGKAVRRGMENGHKELIKTLKESLAKTEKLLRISTKALRQPEAKAFEPNLRTAKLRIEIESILFNSPLLARLAEAKGASISVVVSNQFLRLNNAPHVFNFTRQEKAATTAQQAFLHVKTNLVIIEDTFQDGETLKIEIFLNSTLPIAENKVYEVLLDGDVHSWIGDHYPPINSSIQNNAPVGVWLNVSRLTK